MNDTLRCSLSFLQRETTPVVPVCFPGHCGPSKVGSTFKRKKLLLEEQIPFFFKKLSFGRIAKGKLNECTLKLSEHLP